MTRASAVKNLFVAFGAVRADEQANLYVDELTRTGVCGDCAEVAVEGLMRSAKRLPPLAMVLDETVEVMRSETHTRHVTGPQLAPRAETWWRSEAIKILLPHCDDDRDVAGFVAATFWRNKVDSTHDAVGREIFDCPGEPDIARRTFRTKEMLGQDAPTTVGYAYARARFEHERGTDEPLPEDLANLGPVTT